MSLLKLLGIDKYTTRLKEWVNSQIDKKHAEFVGAAPEQLNTINELAAALGNDENFASTVTNELSKKINKEDVVFEKGESDNSAALKGGNNQVLSENSVAIGNSNIAGLRGWYYGSINKIDDTTIDVYISDSQRGILNYPTWGGATKFSNLNPYEVLGNNTVVSLINDVKYDNKFKVIGGEAGRIRLQTVSGNLPFSSIATELVLDPEDYSIYCLTKPDAGVADVSLSSIAEGRSTKALGACSHAEGYNTTASGKYSHVEGRDTEALYIAHAEGSQTKALGNASHAEGTSTQALNSNSHAEGFETEVKGYAGHAEGKGTKVLSDYGHSEGELTEVSTNSNSAHAEGIRTKASNTAAHAEGRNTIAAGVCAHAEGYNDDNNVDYGAFGAISHTEGYATVTTSTANSGHAEGRFTTVSGMGAHAEGISNTASGEATHVEGKYTKATGEAAHAEGKGESDVNPNLASGNYSHVEGEKTKALGMAAHAEGGSSIATGNFSHSEGRFTRAHALCSHAEGFSVEGKEDEYGAFGPISHVEGYANITTSEANSAHAEGRLNTASGMGAHVEGISNIASGEASHAEGMYTKASGKNSHAEGNNTTSVGTNSHAEGSSIIKAKVEAGDTVNSIKQKWTDFATKFSLAYGDSSHVEGANNLALGDCSHAEGKTTIAEGDYSHAEGEYTIAVGDHSHAEGYYTKATGNYSHAEGRETTTTNEGEHAEGKYNKSTANKTIHSVGIGTPFTGRKNAHEIMNDGKHYIYNLGGYDGTNPSEAKDVATYIKSLETRIAELEATINILTQNSKLDSATLDNLQLV